MGTPHSTPHNGARHQRHDRQSPPTYSQAISETTSFPQQSSLKTAKPRPHPVIYTGAEPAAKVEQTDVQSSESMRLLELRHKKELLQLHADELRERLSWATQQVQGSKALEKSLRNTNGRLKMAEVKAEALRKELGLSARVRKCLEENLRDRQRRLEAAETRVAMLEQGLEEAVRSSLEESRLAQLMRERDEFRARAAGLEMDLKRYEVSFASLGMLLEERSKYLSTQMSKVSSA